MSLDQLSGTTFTVNSTGDGADSSSSDDMCDDGNGNCTLRAAIQEANRNDGSIIVFDISGGGARTIQPASALPTITRTVFIDGFSQSGASASNYRIELDGTNAGTNTNGLTISGTEAWVRGLSINEFGGNGIVLQGSGGKQVIDQNRIGTNVSGTGDSGNGKSGVLVSGSDRVILRDNLISGNDGHGVELSGGADYAIIDGNIIGANASGTSDLGNTGSGIHISYGDEAIIGKNVIVGNDSHGVSLTGSSTEENLVAENYVGVNESGTSIANSGLGVHIGGGADDNAVRHNTIANNTGDGVTVVGNSSAGNTVWENSIYSNDGLGIDLNDDGVTGNDAGTDPDSGTNNLQNFAVLTSAGLSSDAGSIGFSLYVQQNNTYIVDFYASGSCDASGNGEGKEWVGFARVVPKTFGDRHFVVHTFRGTLNQYDYPSGNYITATVTRDRSTSEFSTCVQNIALPRLTLSEDSIEVVEDGTANTTYTVRLSSQPSHDATVDLTIEGDEVFTVSPTPLTFTGGNSGNWQTPQTVTVTGVSDDDPEDESTVIQHRVTIDSKRYVSEWLPAAVEDDDVPDVTLVIEGNNTLTGVATMEEGQFATYPVALTEEPDDDVTVSIYSSSSSALRVSPSSLTFTKDNYDTAQNVTITARSDSDAEDELVNVYHEVLVGGSYYEVARVRAIITDPIFPRLTLSEDTLSVSEGETNTYTIVPAAEPSWNFTITLESSDTESVTVSPPNATFTRGTNGNWETPQTITVTGVQDDDEFDDVALIRHLSTYSGIEYRLGSGVEVTVADGNRAPFFEEGVKITRSVPENSPLGTNVGEPVAATDLNSDTLTYTIEDQVGGPYEVDNTGQITVGTGAGLDYESRTTQEVQLTVEDPDGLSDTIEVQIEITDVNEPPVITGNQDLEWQENRAGNLARYSATDPERDSFEWSVIGSDFIFFSMDSSGYLTFVDPPDFEASRNNAYEVTVVAMDSEGQFGTLNIKVTVTNANEPPTVTGEDGITIDENTDTFSRTYFASDPEGVASTFTWSLSGTDSGDFNIDTITGELTFRNTPDFESPADSGRNNEYMIAVRATDEGNLRGSLDVTITVNDINEPPTVTGDDTLSYPENTAADRVLDRYSASDPERSPIMWAVGGTDSGAFAVDSNGNLTFDDAPDHEAPTDSGGNNVYDIQVIATDDGNLRDGTPSLPGTLSTYFDVKVTVTPVNEAPTVTGDIAPTVDENSETFSRRYHATDPEGVSSTFTWSLSGTDGSDFNINRNTGELTFRNTPDYERPADSGGNNEYLVTVRATDQGNLRGELPVTITENDINEAPTITGSATPPDFPENSVRSVSTYRATDPERGTITWSVSGTDSNDFDISDTGVLTFASIPDFEGPTDSNQDNEYLVTVEARDDEFNTDRLDVTVTVTNSTGTEEPTITTTSRPVLSYQENDTNTVYTYRARDPQGRAVMWTLEGTDDGAFEISSSGALTFASPPDFEMPTDSNQDNVYVITVVVTDDQGLTDRFDVTIAVTNHHENQEPAITTHASSGVTFHKLSYQENRTSTVYTYRATNYGSGSISWSLSGTDFGDFTIATDTSGRGVLTFGSTPDFESPDDANNRNDYEITVVVANAGGYTDRLDVVVTVTDVNEGPEVIGGGDSFNVRENQDWSGASFTASDPEGGPITRWNLGGRDGSDFNISETGVITFRNVPDYERPDDGDRDNVYEVEVRPYDGRYYGSHDVTVTVGDVNEITGPATLGRSENFEGVLAIYRATGQGDLTVSPAWRLTGTDSGDFAISEQGDLTFRSNPDYERPADSNRDNKYMFTVQASDDRYYGTLDVTVTVTPVNEPPTITTRSRTEFTQPENRTTRLYTWRATDPEGGSTITWSLSGADSRFFTIDEQLGEFSFATTSPPDFEARSDSNSDNVYNVTIRVSDDSSPPHTETLDATVTVTDVNEGPEITRGGSRFTVQENQDWAGETFTASDPEQGAVTRWNLGGRDGGDFTITENGLMTFRSAPDYERPADSDRNNIYEVEVRPYDGRYYGSHDVTVTVGDVNEITGPATLDRSENFEGVLAIYRATGQGDLTVSPAWRLTGTDRGDSTINEGGDLTFRSNPDYERPADSNRDNKYMFTVQASDDRYYATLDVTVTVTPVNEPPTITTRSRTEFTQPENRTTRLYSWRATDPEGGSTIEWSLGGADRRFFTINQRGEFSFRETDPPDFEARSDSNSDNVYNVTIRVSDDSSPPHTETLDATVTVTDVNEGPEITRGGSRFTVQENQDWAGASFTASDPEQGAVTRWNLGGRDGGDFTITENGLMTFRSAPDYERPVDSDRNNIYEVEIRPYDGRYYGSHHVTVTVTPINEAPDITTTSTSATSLSHPENRTTRLYTYRATDPENRAIRWSVTGTHARFFSINERGELFFSETGPPNFENPLGSGSEGNEYQVTVEASDGTHPDTLAVTVTVTDVNEGPKVTSGGNSFTVPENQAWSGASFIATDPEGDSVTRWNLGGRDGSDFNITENGDMTFRNIPDHERPADSDRNNIYEVEVRPYDGRYYGSHAVTVTVTPENEAPTITTTSTSATSLRQQENRTSRLYTYRATDPENRAIRWSVGGTDGRFFTIDERGQFSFKEENSPNYEIPSDAGRDNVYDVTVLASDGTHSDALTVTVTVTDVNEGPEISRSGNLLGNPPVSVPEDQAQDTVLARYSATDPEGLVSPITRWSTSGRDGGDFVISEQGDLRFRNSPDFERPADSDRDNVYEVTIRASDGRYTGTLEETQIVTVTPIKEAPTITTTSRRAFTQPENRNSALYTFRATDPEGATITWSPGGVDGSFFTINERGALFFTDPPNFEVRAVSGRDNVYDVTVQASDGSLPDFLVVTVTVTDANEGPEISRSGNLFGNPPGSVPENQETVLARYNATDPEDTTATITRWSTSGRDGGDFVINEHGELRFRNSPDFERPADADRDNVYEVTIRASDGRYTGTLEETQVVTVTNVNEPPVITTKSRTEFTQRENTASVLYTYRATDPDLNDVIRWSVEGADGDDFAIFGGVFTFRLLPDFEVPADANRDNVYEITVVAADLQGARDTVEAAITITEVNEGPRVSGTTSFTVAEGQDLAGASFTANDQEGDAVTRWSLSGSDGGDFEISETGVLTFRNIPDYDSPADSNRNNEYLVTVRAYDSGNRYGSLDVRVTVTDVNEESPVVTGRNTLTFRENTTTETRLYTYRATDPDRDTTFTWSVEGNDGGDFAIDEGVLTFRNPPDHEQPADRDTDNVYEITVVASDGSNRGELPVTITVTEINEGPQISGTATYTIPETQDNLANATLTAVDPESDDVTRWSLTGTDSGDFTITDTIEQTGRNTADLTFRNPPDVDRPADSNRDNEYLVTVRAYDRRGAYGSYDVTVTVTGANEPPVITGSNERTFRENGTGTIYTYRATDPERDEFSWIEPAGDDGHLFDISDRGALTFKEPPDFDSPSNLDRDNEYEVTVRAEDSNSSIGTFEVTVTVTDQNEGATVSGQAEVKVQENRDPALTLATYSATDPEGETITRWSLSGSDGGDFSIDESGVLTFRNTPDYDRPADSNRDNEYLVTVRAYDGRSYGTLDVTVTVTNDNEHAPVIRSGSRTSFTYLEGSTSALYTYSATDQDKDDVITWAAGGTDGNLFEFDDRNRLVFREPPDYENPGDSGSDNRYELTVVATDSGNRSDTLTDVTVTVTALDEGPEPTGTTVYIVAEGQSLTNATFSARDPDLEIWPETGFSRVVSYTWGIKK